MTESFLKRPIPRLRPLDIKPIRHEGRDFLMFRDPLLLSDLMVMVPQEISGVVAFFDGERDAEGVSAAIAVRFGVRLPAEVIAALAQALDDALMLDNARAEEARQRALAEYRARPFREPALAGTVYPESPEALSNYFSELLNSLDSEKAATIAREEIVGVLSPHIDYPRGGAVYAETWNSAARSVQEAELAIILGTDHYGGSGEITLTRQNYASPFGTLPTATEIVEEFASAIGSEDAFAHEIRHRGEHSIELAAVWLHYIRGQKPLPTVPVLIGSFEGYMKNGEPPESDPRIRRFIESLSKAIQGKRVLVVIAADLVHLGPAFGHEAVTESQRALIREADKGFLEAMATAHGDGLISEFRKHPYHDTICGLAPLYVASQALRPSRVEPISYAQCPADADNTSLVSICGALLLA